MLLKQKLLRKLNTSSGLIDLTSNDYFGFAKLERTQKACAGATGSRLLTGNSFFYEQLEEQIARFHKAESCLIFTSGYTANIGLISALGTPSSTFLYDLEIHASMIDGMRLGKGKKLPFRHNDLESLEQRLTRAQAPVFVLIESIYSISGDIAPIEEIVQLCIQYQAHLIVDEAHATGNCGPCGEGLVCQLHLESKVFARVHTFSKALGAHGACILGSEDLKQYLINFSRPFIYTTALPPSVLEHIAYSYERLKKEAPKHQRVLRRLIDYFCKQTANLNFGFLSSESMEIFDEIAPVSSQKISEGNIFKKKQAQDREKIIDSERIKPEVQVARKVTCSPIQPLYIGDIDQVRAVSHTLRKKGIDVRAILPPTVGKGKECLRIVLHSFNQQSEIDQLLEILK